jgi:hypothetical protein
MERDSSAFDQSDGTGFIRLNALRQKLRAVLKGRTIDPFDFAQSRLSIARLPVARFVSTQLT